MCFLNAPELFSRAFALKHTFRLFKGVTSVIAVVNNLVKIVFKGTFGFLFSDNRPPAGNNRLAFKKQLYMHLFVLSYKNSLPLLLSAKGSFLLLSEVVLLNYSSPDSGSVGVGSGSGFGCGSVFDSELDWLDELWLDELWLDELDDELLLE